MASPSKSSFGRVRKPSKRAASPSSQMPATKKKLPSTPPQSIGNSDSSQDLTSPHNTPPRAASASRLNTSGAGLSRNAKNIEQSTSLHSLDKMTSQPKSITSKKSIFDIKTTLEIKGAGSGTQSPAPSESNLSTTEPVTKVQHVFKDPNFVHSSRNNATGKRAKAWKSLKHIIQTEKTLPWNPDDPTYGTIDAPPSFKPAKKYSDLSGLEARYTDPQTKIRYSTATEFSQVRVLPSDLISGYLALRKAIPIVP